MLATTQGPRRRGAALLAAVVAVVVAACGGSTTPTTGAPRRASAAAPSAARARDPPRPAPRPRRAPPATPARPRRSSTRSGATRRRSPASRRSWTRSTRPTRTSRSTSTCPTGTPTGTSSRPASPAATRPTCSRWTARCSPTTSRATSCSTSSRIIDRDGYDLTQLADQGVADFTTADGGQFGLPRDLNTIALYYNKDMFDAAGIPYPDDTWDWAKLVDVAKQLTKDGNGDGKADQWGFYTETTDMENYWLSLVWQNGGDILAPDGKSTLLGTDQAAGGIQFLQDLIWKDKVMPDPAISAETGDAFEQGQAAMEANGSWLVPTHQAAGHRLRDRAAAEGPGRPVHLGQPDRRGRLQGHEEPRRRLGVREVPRQPGGPGAADAAQGVAAGEQGGPRRAVRHVVRRRARCSPTPRLRPAQAVVQGLQRVDDGAPGRARHQRLQRPEQDGQGGARGRRARSSTPSSPAQ